MNKTLIAAAVALELTVALAAPGTADAASTRTRNAARAAQPTPPAATADDVRALRDQLQALSDRLQRLEQTNQQLQQSNTELAAQNQKLVAQTEEVEKSNDAQTDAIAKIKSKADAADWAGRIKFSGDARYRDEEIRRDLREGTQSRERIRARIAATARVNDDINVGIRLATGADDPRSPNQTLGASGTPLARRTIGLDQYWIAWKPSKEFTIQGGKFAIPYWRPGQSVLNDSDINPEGLAVGFQQGVFFANAYGFWLNERGSATKNQNTGAIGSLNAQQQGTTYSGLQLGVKLPLGASTLQLAAMYANLGAGQGRQPFWFGPASPAVAANGNSVDAAGNLVFDFREVEVSAEWAMKLGVLPFSVWANYATNTAAKSFNYGTVAAPSFQKLDKAYTAGFLLGKASDPNTWEIGYAYEKLDKDGYFGQFVDSDYGAGFTDTKGSVIRLGYAPAKNWTLNATYFINKLNVSGASAAAIQSTTAGLNKQNEGYKRLQLDFVVKY